MPRWLRDPLLHFALAGVAIYAWLPRDEAPAARRIEVQRADLLGFLQNRARLFDGTRVSAAYEALAPAERQQLLRDFVRQEALYREARAQGLDQVDPVIRSRLVQQMELLLRDQAAARVTVTDEDVAAYYAAHRGDYAVPATVSFGHVFFDAQRHGAATRERALAELARLRQRDMGLEEAIARGDRFPYQRHYADAVPAALVPELGEAMAEAVQDAPLDQWHGPVESPLGLHLLRIARRTPASMPALAQIREAVAADALQARQAERGEAAVRELLARYAVAPAADLADLSATAPLSREAR